MNKYIWLLGLCFAPLSFASDTPAQARVKDLYLREAYFYTYQGKFFDAITRLGAEYPQIYESGKSGHDPSLGQITHAKFSISNAELSYRMSQRAELVIKESREGSIDQLVLNEIAYRLAHTCLQQGNSQEALNIINKITGEVAEEIQEGALLLRAQIYLTNKQYEEAVKVLQEMGGVEGIAAYNLGIALILNGQEQKGREKLDKTGLLTSDGEENLAVKDRANLILGYRLLENGQPGLAKEFFDRVRLTGPFSNKALMGSGWADFSLGNFKRALGPWTILRERKVTDMAVQESMLAVPFAYSRLGLYGKAFQLYGVTLEQFDLELAKLDRSIKSIREGDFLQDAVRSELKHGDKWAVKLHDIPGAVETDYLLELMATGGFHEQMVNYFDLEDLQRRLAVWDEDIGIYEELIELRRKHYEQRLPDIDKKVQALDAPNKWRLAKRQRLDELLKEILAFPSPDWLATTIERDSKRALLDSFRDFESEHRSDASKAANQIRIRGRRLLGVLQWQIDSAYSWRLADILEQVQLLDIDEKNLEDKYDTFFMLRRVAAESYKGYDEQIRLLKSRVLNAQEKVKMLIARQGHQLEEMAINELGVRRKLLEEFQVQAIFALAESYDQASRKQSAWETN